MAQVLLQKLQSSRVTYGTNYLLMCSQQLSLLLHASFIFPFQSHPTCFYYILYYLTLFINYYLFTFRLIVHILFYTNPFMSLTLLSSNLSAFVLVQLYFLSTLIFFISVYILSLIHYFVLAFNFHRLPNIS